MGSKGASIKFYTNHRCPCKSTTSRLTGPEHHQNQSIKTLDPSQLTDRTSRGPPRLHHPEGTRPRIRRNNHRSRHPAHRRVPRHQPARPGPRALLQRRNHPRVRHRRAIPRRRLPIAPTAALFGLQGRTDACAHRVLCGCVVHARQWVLPQGAFCEERGGGGRVRGGACGGGEEGG